MEINNSTRIEILNSIENKFEKIPNVGHLQVWLQRLTIKANRDKNYTEKLCQRVINNNMDIWNNSWLNHQSIKDILTNHSIIDEQKIAEMEQVIDPDEVSIFGY